MRRLHNRIFISASAIAIAAVPGAALAQTTNANAQPTNPTQDVLPQSDVDPNLPPDGTTDAQEEGGAIVVTGSRIRSPQYSQPNPIVSVDSADIQNAGVTNLTDFLAENPALQGSTTSNDTSGTNAGIGQVGLNLLNLRNLGTGRTLTLVDGRRHVAAVPGSASVDINTIPVDLIERVDVVTGGAAVYGADAVTGVVNFVLRRNFEGIAIRAQSGISEYGDNANQFVAVTAGMNFMDGRGNIAGSFEYGHADDFGRNSRSFLTPQGLCSFYGNAGDVPDNPNVPDNVLECDVRYNDSSPIGAVDTNLDFVVDRLGNGQLFDFGRQTGSVGFQVGGSGTPVSTYSGDILPQTDRYVANLLFNFDLTDSVAFFAQAKYARIDSETENQPSFDFYLRARLDNPFIPASLRAAAASAGNTFGLLVNRDNFDLGRRGATARRETYRGVIGLRADLTDRISLEAAYVYGRSENRTTETNNRLNDRFFAALDAVDQGQFLTGTPNGNIVCRSNLAPATSSNQNFGGPNNTLFSFAAPPNGTMLSFTPGANSGCVPFNLFADNSQNQAAIDFITTTTRDFSRLDQHVASLTVSGDLGESIRLWGGNIGFALGAEYRKEESRNQPDPIRTQFYTFGNRIVANRGSFDVREAFAELRVPIIADRPFFNELTVNGAARYSDYSTIGDTFTWQVGAVYSPIRDIRFRAAYSNLVRAPNIAELFSPVTQTFAFVTDPCAIVRRNNGTALRAPACVEILTGLGLTPAQIAAYTAANGNASIPGLVQGNVNLQEERAKTVTAGVVLQPRFLPGLSFSVDYYDIRIENAVSTASATTIAALCVDQPRPNQFCDAVDRNPSTSPFPGTISGFRLQPLNVAQFRSEGIDFAANYRLTTDNLGIFNFRLVANHLLRLDTQATPTGAVTNNVGVIEAPEWTVNTATTWLMNNFSFTWRANFFSETFRTTRLTLQNQPDFFPAEFIKVDARFTHDFQANLNVDDRFNFYLGVNNAFGQLPDVGQTFYPVSAVGLTFYAGARLRFGGSN